MVIFDCLNRDTNAFGQPPYCLRYRQGSFDGRRGGSFAVVGNLVIAVHRQALIGEVARGKCRIIDAHTSADLGNRLLGLRGVERKPETATDRQSVPRHLSCLIGPIIARPGVVGWDHVDTGNGGIVPVIDRNRDHEINVVERNPSIPFALARECNPSVLRRSD